MKFRAGDIVSILGTVQYDQDPGSSLFVVIEGTTRIIDAQKATMVQPFIKPGEMVMVSGVVWTAICTHKNMLWAERDDEWATFDVANVARIDQPAEIPDGVELPQEQPTAPLDI